ncbi:MAG: PEGA domain-containing protein [Candidatus Eisenbacteria bacterium]|uniref:PEGA domain-containing protein n=1 Tax=Eiseniibacteriota bacterium TaxID=2212470 RepID=A0A956SFM1_UNCEI|nr:PEGA domain-containing protein [Candidatus Eisenbacteria bacterium]MCB9466181.1 PEGA domain-containing protein [Candidatus Eisenbacteria bacterium]
MIQSIRLCVRFSGILGLLLCGGAQSIQAAVPLVSDPDEGPLLPGDRFEVRVDIGSSDEPADDLLGVAFRLEFDPYAFAPVGVEPGGFFPLEETLVFTRPDSSGTFSYSQTMISGAGVSGFGTLVRFELEVRSDAGSGSYVFPIDRPEVVDLHGQELPTSIVIGETLVEGPDRGACCLPSGSCVLVTESVCSTESGTYLGDGTTCEGSPCGEATGALLVESVPEGATIVLDGVLTGETTPHLFEGLPVGSHCVEWLLRGHGGCRSAEGDCLGLEYEVMESDTTDAFCRLTPYFTSVLQRRATTAPATLLSGNAPLRWHEVYVEAKEPWSSEDVIPRVVFLGELPVAAEDWTTAGERLLRFRLSSHQLTAAAQQRGGDVESRGRTVAIPLLLPMQSGEWSETEISLTVVKASEIELVQGESLATVAFPNPVRDGVFISWDDPMARSAVVSIADIAGRRVATIHAAPNLSGVTWDGKAADGVDLPNGVYSYRIDVDGQTGRGRVLLLR